MSAKDAEMADDAEVMRIWRECGLPEYFLGNGGSNHRLAAFAKACSTRPAPDLVEALERLLDEADGFNVSGVYFGEERPAREAINRARAAIAKAAGRS